MIIKTNTAEGGTDSAAVTTGNSGGASGDAWTVVSSPSGSVTYSASQYQHGSLGYLFSPASGQQSLVRWTGFNDKAGAVRFYLPTGISAHSSNEPICMIYTATGTGITNISVNSAGNYIIQDATGSSVHLFTSVCSAGDRIEYSFTVGTTTSNGSWNFALYQGDALTPVETGSGAAENFGTTAWDRVQFGKITTSTWTGTIGFDDMTVASGTTTLPALNAKWGVTPTIASMGSTVVSTTTSAAIPVPAGIVSTSLVVVWFWSFWIETGTAPTAAAFSPSAGFVLGDFRSLLDTNIGFYSASAWYYKYATGSESGTYSFSISTVGGTAPFKSFGTAFNIANGPGNDNPFVDGIRYISNGGAVTSVTIPAFTPGGDSSLFMAGYVDGSATAVTLPAGWATDSSTLINTSTGYQVIGHNSQTIATNTGALTFSATGAASSMFAHMCVIRPPLAGLPWLSFS